MQMLKKPTGPESRDTDRGAVAHVVDEIVSAVAAEGDAAVRRYSAALDGWEPEAFRLGDGESGQPGTG